MLYEYVKNYPTKNLIHQTKLFIENKFKNIKNQNEYFQKMSYKYIRK
jgi:hypothetical protein